MKKCKKVSKIDKKVALLSGLATLGTIGGIAIGWFLGHSLRLPPVRDTKPCTIEPKRSNDVDRFELPVGEWVDYWRDFYGRTAIVGDMKLKDVHQMVDAFMAQHDIGEDAEVDVLIDIFDKSEEESKK